MAVTLLTALIPINADLVVQASGSTLANID
jgi:hypothetical protein